MSEWKCEHAASGCNYPESECSGLCEMKTYGHIMKPTFEDIEKKVVAWAQERQIIPNATSTSQLLKAFAEMGELADAHNKGRMAEVADGVGDVLVCLINYCALECLNITGCLEMAYDEIKDRKGTMLPSGVFVKEGDKAV